MTDAVSEAKKNWRRLAVEVFGLLPRDSRRSLDIALSRQAEGLRLAERGSLLLGYAPMSDEPDLTAFYRRWQASGGVLALPVWLGGNKLVLRRVNDLEHELRAGRGGIMEPLDTLPEVDPGEPDIVMTPGRVFSEGRDRLGRGSGCYDALLRHGSCLKIGIAYDFQVVPVLPVHEHDVPMDIVVTPSRVMTAEGGFSR